jgi:hypothetical protein
LAAGAAQTAPATPTNETASVSPDWNGPHFARLDAWFERPERILAEIPQRAGQS